MYKVVVLDYKRQTGKVHAMKSAMELLRFSIKESKDWVENLPKTVEVRTRDEAEAFYQYFNIDIRDMSQNEYPSNYNIREPDEATKEALAWRETLSEKEQEMIKLIADWENPVCIAAVR